MEAVEPEAVAESRAEANTRGKKNRAKRVAATAKRTAKKLKDMALLHMVIASSRRRDPR